MEKARSDSENASTESECVWQLVRFLWLTLFVLLTSGFLFASSIPLVFAVDDLPTRVVSMFDFKDWHLVNDLLWDTILNVIALFPIGFVGSAVCCVISIHPQSGLRTFGIAACMSLAIAIGAEGIQIWIPMRTPSCRDVLTLETGGILGAGLWWAVGKGTMEFICRVITPVARWEGRRILRYRWLGLFALLFVACLSLNLYASPLELFLAYSRRMSVNDAWMNRPHIPLFMGPRPVHSLWIDFVPSFLSSAAVIAACILTDRVLPGGRTWQTSHVARDARRQTGSNPSCEGASTPRQMSAPDGKSALAGRRTPL
jgi:hypothetical protein